MSFSGLYVDRGKDSAKVCWSPSAFNFKYSLYHGAIFEAKVPCTAFFAMSEIFLEVSHIKGLIHYCGKIWIRSS